MNGVGVIVPVDRELPEEEILRCLARAEADAVVFAESRREVMHAIARKAPFIRHLIDMQLESDAAGVLSFDRLLARGRALLDAGRRDYLDAAIDPEAMSVLLFTSGTTSEAKAVPLSHRNLCADLMATVRMITIGPGDVFLSILPDPPHLRVHLRLPGAAVPRRNDRLLRRPAPHPAQPAGVEVLGSDRGPAGA